MQTDRQRARHKVLETKTEIEREKDSHTHTQTYRRTDSEIKTEIDR